MSSVLDNMQSDKKKEMETTGENEMKKTSKNIIWWMQKGTGWNKNKINSTSNSYSLLYEMMYIIIWVVLSLKNYKDVIDNG